MSRPESLKKDSGTQGRPDRDKQLLEQYSWYMYKIMPPVMATSVEAALLKEVVNTGMSYEECGELLKDGEFRRVFLGCWELGSFDNIRSHTHLLSAEEQLGGCSKSLVAASTPMPTGGQTTIYGSTFLDVAGDFWQINYSEDRTESLAKWLSQFDHRVTHNAVSKKRAPNTGDWFLRSSEFIDFCKSTPKSILWCPGIPGVGKTVIASLAIDYLRKCQPNGFIGFIYFDFKLRSVQNLDMVLESLCRQVYETSTRDEVSAIFGALYDIHKKRQTRPTTTELQITLSKALSLFDCCFLVLDALDEYLEPYSDAKIRQLLHALTSDNSQVCLLVTSRPLTGLSSIFQDLDGLQREIKVADEDLYQYITGRLESEEFNFDISQTLKMKIIGAVKYAAKGRFLMAQLNMDHLAEQLSPGDLEDALSTLPDNQDAAYANVMERIEGYPDSRKVIAKKAIMLIAYTSRPLHIEELRHAIACKKGLDNVKKYLTPLSTISAACAGLLVIRGDKVVFVHFTAQEFFDNPQTQAFHFPNANLEIAHLCLEYLSLGVLSGDALANEYSHELVQQLPFYDYAALHWGMHTGMTNDGLEAQIWRFLSGNSQLTKHNATYIIFACRNLPRRLPRHYDVPSSAASLFVAIFHNQLSATQRLLKTIDELPIATCLGSGPWITPLIMITQSHQIDILKVLIGQFGMKIQDSEDSSLLSHVVMCRLEEAVEYILKQPGADAIIQLKVGMRARIPLHIAVEYRNLAIARHLLEYDEAQSPCTGQQIIAKDCAGVTPFIYAIQQGNQDIVELMLTCTYTKMLNEAFNIGGDTWVGATPLMVAISNGHVAVTELLLQKGADIDTRDDSGSTPLLLAAGTCNADLIKLVLESGGSTGVNSKDDNGRAPISRVVDQVASHMEKSEEDVICCLSLLLDLDNINLNPVDNKGRTPLYFAYKAGYTKKVVPLLEHHGAQLIPNLLELPADFLFTAASDGVVPVVKLLLERGGITCDPRGTEGRTALSLAAGQCHNAMLKLLLSQPWVDPNAQDEEGKTALHWASQGYYDSYYTHLAISNSQFVETVMQLLQHADTDISIQDKNGQSYLSLLLLTKSFNEWAQDLPLAIVTPVNLLLQHDPNMLNCPDNNGNTPLALVAQQLAYKNLQILLGTPGIDINFRNNNGETPLMLACQSTSNFAFSENYTFDPIFSAEPSLKALLAQPLADVNIQDNNGRTALSWAACALNAGCIERPSLHTPNLGTGTPQCCDCDIIQFPEVYAKERVSLLLEMRDDVDLNLADNNGHPPLWYAQKLGYNRVAQLLIAKGAKELDSTL